MIRFESWGEFVVMDGHGSYVLAAYAIGLVCFLGLLLESRLRLRALKRASQRQRLIEESSR
ncbi:MAG: heme exporter protein CcmD [Gammaproteobacteria bacterium]|jgi:heme exporter protein CcmD|nr:heme exporter protein CcmD [Gammaproteobacteria bacterium]